MDVSERSVTRKTAPGDLFASWLLRAGAAHVRINAKIGRSANNFFTHEAGSKILAYEAGLRPDIVFVFLGTNDIGLGMEIDGKRMMQIRAAFLEVGAEVWVIGPPSFPPNSVTLSGLNRNVGAVRVVKMEKAVFGANRFIDARPLTNDLVTVKAGRAGDGVHFGHKGARIFAKRLAQRLGLTGSEEIASVSPTVKAVVIGTSIVMVTGGAVLLLRR